MRVPQHVVDARRRQLAELLQRHRYYAVQDLCAELGVSEATIRRDLVHLTRTGLVTRTYGGVLADFNLRFPSFRQRRASGEQAKAGIAARALALLQPGMTFFLDGGSTLFALAEALREAPVRPLICVTNNLPAADVLAEVDGIAVHLLGGQLIRRQSVLLGGAAVTHARLWRFDLALLSAQGMTRDGLWNTEPAIIALQHAVLSQAGVAIALLDAAKIGRTTPHFLAGWDRIGGLITDAGSDALASAAIPPAKCLLPVISVGNDPGMSAGPGHFDTPAPALAPPPAGESDEKNDLTLPVSLL